MIVSNRRRTVVTLLRRSGSVRMTVISDDCLHQLSFSFRPRRQVSKVMSGDARFTRAVEAEVTDLGGYSVWV